jgi:hypothetical protein
MSYFSTVSVIKPGVTISYAPAPAAASTMPGSFPSSPTTAVVDYYVYRCAPDTDVPMHHWKFYPMSMSKDDLPDIRLARPLYTWNSTTGQYRAVEEINVKY